MYVLFRILRLLIASMIWFVLPKFQGSIPALNAVQLEQVHYPAPSEQLHRPSIFKCFHPEVQVWWWRKKTAPGAGRSGIYVWGGMYHLTDFNQEAPFPPPHVQVLSRHFCCCWDPVMLQVLLSNLKGGHCVWTFTQLAWLDAQGYGI